MSKLQHNEPFLQLGTTGEGKRPFILSGTDFERHKVISGITGAGKSFFLASMYLLLFKLGITTLLIDPNGDLAKLIVTLLASSDYFSDPRAYSRLWYVDFKRAEKDYAIAFNLLKQDYEAHTVANNLLEAMHRAFPVSGTTTSLDNVILAASLVLIENNLPITQLPRLILDSQFRDRLLRKVSDPLVVEFFRSKFGEKVNSNLVDSTMRRSFLLTFSPVLRNTLGQRDNKLNMRHILDSGISCIFNLGGCDDQSKRLLGGALLVNIEQAFLSRADIDPHSRKAAHIIIDEFPVFSSHSEQSFAIILEQVRKYKGTLYLAHQTQSQLSSGMAGSLQNAVSINMKSGYTDSSTLVQQFYRPRVDQSDSLIASFLRLAGLMPEKQQSVFDGLENTNQAKYLFETLQRQEAIVTLNGISTLIKTNTIPDVDVDPRTLAEIEDTYATKLLTPLAQINTSPPPSAASFTLPSISRRIPVTEHATPFQTYVNAPGSETDTQGIVQLYGYVTVSHVAKLINKSDTACRNKLKKLLDAGLLTVASVPSVSGKTPLCYSVKAKKPLKGQLFLDHALATTDILIHTVMLPDALVLDLKSDLAFKASPIQVGSSLLIPDAQVRLAYKGYEYNLYYEIDRNTETAKEKIVSKLNSYKVQASSNTCMAVCFCCVEGGDLRVKTLRNWATDVVPEDLQELFLFASVDLDTLTPETLLTSPLWLSVYDSTPKTLLSG